MFIVTKPSGINILKTCLLGSGPTKAAAMVDAYGPKPWSPYTAKAAKSADVREVSDEEFERISENSY